MDVKIKIEKPPVFHSICSTFGIVPKNVYFTYGDTIYNPDDLEVSEDIIAHECVHMEQQNHNEADAALWWGRYLREPQFRIEEESEAYAAQYHYLCSIHKDRNKRFKILHNLACSLSGPLYNNAISYLEARQLIKNLSKVT